MLYAVDLFCGAGGLTRGLLDEGVQVLAGYDIDPACRYPYEYNNEVPFVECDLMDVDPREVDRLFPQDGIRIIAGCAPCQPYSIYSRGSKRVYEDRWHLLGAFRDIVDYVSPELVTLENVRQLRKHHSYWQFVRDLKRMGYRWSEYVVDCRQYGIPQSRTRLVAFASMFGSVQLTPSTHPEDHPVTVRQTISHMPTLRSGEENSSDRLHKASRLGDLNLKRIRVSRPGSTWREWDKSLIAECHNSETGNTYPSVYGRMEWDRPAPTLTTQYFGFGNGRFGHPEQDRAISLREGALLQTFPPDYEFVDPNEDVRFNVTGRLIGNAVPLLLGRAVGRSLNVHMKDYI